MIVGNPFLKKLFLCAQALRRVPKKYAVTKATVREMPPAARRSGGSEVVETETVGDHCYEFTVCGFSSAGVYGVAEI